MNDRPTPITDAAAFNIPVHGMHGTGFRSSVVPYVVCHDLERQLAEANARIAELENHLSPKPDDGWIPWSGGECPIPNAVRFSVRFRGGRESVMIRSDASGVLWGHHDGDASDIVAYRVMSDSP